MINLQTISLEKETENTNEVPSNGELILSDDITFIAGPNGSGKTQILNFLSKCFSDVASLPPGTKFRFQLSDIKENVREVIETRLDAGREYCGELVDNSFLRVTFSDSRNTLYLPNWFESDNDRPINNSSQNEELHRLIGDANIREENGKVVRINDEYEIPASIVQIPKVKFLDAQRMRNINNALNRQSNPYKHILGNNPDDKNPSELFSILEADPELEVEILSRIEALTGVKITVEKEGRQYNILCTRTGREGSWNYGSEADGVISLLILLPYLYTEIYDIIFIDEPEAHLYPGLQQTLRTLIYDACERTGKKVVLATHSEKIVAPPMTNFRESVHVTIPHPNRHEIIQLHQAISNMGDDSGELHRWLRDQAFGDNQDSLFSALFASETIIVEGPFDMIFLDRIARFVGREYRAGSVALLEAGGKGGVNRLVRLLKSMGRLTKVIVDSDIIDQPGVLYNISNEMGDSDDKIRQLIETDGELEEIQNLCRKFDIHILSHPGIEYYYYEEDNPERLRTSSQKRTSLIRELKSLEDLNFNEVRERYSELIEILEAAVHRMPEEWLEAHSRETNKLLAEISHEWRSCRKRGIENHEEILEEMTEWLQRFSNYQFNDQENLILTHRFLSAVPIEIGIEDNPVDINEEWIRNFEL